MVAYVYKLTSDNGGAPCVADSVLSLAICKPIIRSTAQPGSWIFGFAANSLCKSHPENRLIYVARVDEVIPAIKYYADCSVYRGRADFIYRPLHGGFEWRKGSAFHLNGVAMDHDLGTASRGFDRAWVLISTEFRYFGSKGKSLLPSDRPLRDLINRLSQGHRRNLDTTTLQALKQLKDEAFDLVGLPLATVVRESGAGCMGSCEQGFATNDGTCA